MPIDLTEQLTRISVVVPVFRDIDGACNAVRALRAQTLSAGVTLEIVVVDDGSGNSAAERLKESLPPDVDVVSLGENQGRSRARQRGIDVATGDVIVFVDCDCEPTDASFLSKHLANFAPDMVASIGPVVGTGSNFWDHYQRKASARRRALFESGVHFSGSTQNMMVRGDALRHVGGFDSRYVNYGFEDRDLLVRLAKLGRIGWCQDAVVRHLDRISMLSVADKLKAAGAGSRLFADQHPDAYQALGYAAIDIHERAWLQIPELVLRKLVSPVSKGFDLLERRRLLPRPVAFAAARAISAASFLLGTADAKRQRGG